MSDTGCCDRKQPAKTRLKGRCQNSHAEKVRRELGARNTWGKSEDLRLILHEVQIWREGVGWIARREGKAGVTGSPFSSRRKMQKVAILTVLTTGRRAIISPLLQTDAHMTRT